MDLPPELRGSVFTTMHATDHRLSRNHLQRLTRERQIWRILHGVYACSALPDGIDTRVAALELVVRPGLIVCDRTAAWLHRVDTFEYRELEVLPRVETCVLPDLTRLRRKGCLGRSRDLAPHDIVRVGRLQVTSELRTALDLGCLLNRRGGLAAIDGFMRSCGVQRDHLRMELPRYRGRRGVVQLRALVALGDSRAESPGESWTRMAMVDAGLPVPELQWEVSIDGVPTYRLDHAYPKSKVAVEYDGLEFHDSPDRREADALRRARLRAEGWIVIVVTRNDFTPAAIDRWTNDVRVALRLR